MFNQKKQIIFLITIYVLSYFLNSLFFINFDKTKAEDSLKSTNIIAILVDQNIYNDLSDEIQRYTKNYIQKEVSNSKAVVLPINVQNFKAQDITKILENMYFDGLKDETSKLVGLILLGDIPLPVINNQGFVYPSIYPYVDFENQKFIRSDQQKYFIYNDNPKGEPEIWHSIINYKDNIYEYQSFFDKLQNYYTNPSDFVDTKIRYDDMIANKNYFYQEALGSYINNFIYSEDIGYHRFTNLLLKMVQGEQNEQISSILSGYQGNFKDDNNQTINGYDVQNSINELNEIKAPTKMLQKMLNESFLKEYDSLMSTKQLARIRDNVQAAGRWIQTYTGEDGIQATRTSFDSHYQKIMQKDDVILRYNAKLYPTLIEFNNILEKSVDKQIEDQKYYMQTPLLVEYQEYKDKRKLVPSIPPKMKCIPETDDTYKNYYFGKSAEYIESVEDTSIYRGTFRNLSEIDGLTTGDIQNSSNPGTDINTNLNLKSLGASFDIFSTQVQGNRGFNIFNSPAEFDLYSGTKKHENRNEECTKRYFPWFNIGISRLCKKRVWKGDGDCDPADTSKQADCEDPSQFAKRNRGGSSPLNLNTGKLENGIYELNYFNRSSAWLPIYDIAGSIAITGNQSEANSFLGIKQYASLTKIQDRYGDLVFPDNHTPYVGKTFFDIYGLSNKDWLDGSYIYLQIGSNRNCGNDWKKYKYKLIDTRYKNTTIKPEQVDGFDYDKFSDKNYLKKYYDYTKLDIDTLYTRVQEQKSEFNGTYTGGVTNNLITIDNTIDQTINGLDQIINFNINNIGNQIQISSGWISITSGVQNQIQILSPEISTGLSNLDNTISMISTNNIEYYISILKSTANFQKEQVQFLSGWNQYLNSKFNLTKSLYTSLQGDFEISQNTYNSINTTGLTDKIIDLQQKRNDINNLQMCGLNNPCGCTNNYTILCSTINQTIININSIKTAIKEIAEYQEYDGASWITTKPFESISLTLSGNNFEQDIVTSLNDINTFQIIYDTSNIPKIHFPGMNITTQDRPVDSPRYITFQGLSGNAVKMIYPDLYKVEVYSQSGDILILKTPQQIETAIKSYLIKVVQKYNQTLQDQLDHKVNFYNTQYGSFNKLQTLNTLANPNRNYQLFNNDYLIQTIGNENIKTISQILYYHNITNQQTKIGSTIAEDIQNKIDGFDINQKISNVMSNYLIQDNDQGPLVTPSYNSKGYEVGFLNSDGQDYISSKPLPSFIQQIQTSKSKFTENNANNQIPQEKSEFEQQLNTECGINEDGTALLLDLSDFSSPWVTAFKCRIKKTLQKPFDISVTFPFSSNIDGFVTVNEIEKQQQIFGSQRSELNPNGFNQSVIANTTSDEDAIKLQEILSYTQTKSNKSSLDMTHNTGTLSILSTKDLGDIKMSIYTTGNDCLFSPGKSSNLCTDHISIPFNPYLEKQTIPIQIKDSKAGTTIITFQLCIPDSETCVKKTQQLNTLPGDIQQLKLITLDDKVMAGSQMPIMVKGLDQYQNDVGQILRNFFITVSTGEISDGSSKSQSIRFNNFNESNFIYYAPLYSSGNNSVSIVISGENTSISASKNLNIIKGIPKAKYGSNIVYQVLGNNTLSGIVKFALPEITSYYHFNDNLGIKQIDQNKLPKIELEIFTQDGNNIPITTFANIKTKNNLVKVGNIQSRNRTIKTGGNTFDVQQMGFYAQNNIQIQSGKVTIFMYPNFKAGDDTLIIDIPGIKTIQIPIQVKSGPAKIIKLQTNKTSIGINKSTKGSIQITDSRGNIFIDPINIKVGTIGPIHISGSTYNPKILTIIGGTYNFDISSKDPGGIGYIFANIDGVNLNNQNPGYETIVVQKTIIPTEKLNIMYLNLFGTDRGNQRGYFSENKNFVQQLMTGSEKLIATTTSLIDPYKIKKIEYLIDTNGQIQNTENLQTNLSSTKTKREIQVDGIGAIYIDNKNFNIIQVTKSETGIYENIQETLQNNLDKNTFYYIPEILDDTVIENTVIQNNIIINSRSVFDTLGNIDSKLSIQLSDKYIEDLNTREIYFEDRLVGTLLINIGETPIISGDIINTTIKLSNTDYQNIITFSDGSTNGKKGIGFYTDDSNFPEDSKGYNSIEDSSDPTLNIGFKGDLKNITSFAGGENVGESTKHFASEFLINYGDPLVKRLNKNTNVKLTDYDGGLGKVIYSDPDKTIFKVKNIDFNNDGLQDFVIVYTDGTIKLVKNYGGNNPYHNLQELSILADGIKEIYIGDVDGNNYDDIIILTQGDQLKAYTNQFGIFDVDGYLICLNSNVKQGIKSEDGSNLSGIDQLFLQDMNKDKKIDIITNDKEGYIKIFYGGNNNSQSYANYVSKLKYTCDPDRYIRQSVNQNTKIVKRFGIQLDEDNKILDNSLIHRKGLSQTSPEDQYQNTEDLQDAGINIDGNQINEYLNNTDPKDIDQDQLIDMVGPDNFDVSKMVGAGAENYLKYVQDPIGIQPIYETLTGENLVFKPLGFLSGNDPIQAYKTYEDINGDILEGGDLVKITVTLKANQNFLGTFIDKISGPREIKMHPEGNIKHFWFKTGTDITDIIMNRKIDNGYSYMLDNLNIPQGEYIQFYYRVNYIAGDNVKIDIKDIDGKDYKYEDSNPLAQYTIDNYPDISTKPSDGCSKSMTVFFNNHNNNGKDYDENYVDLQKIMQEYTQDEQIKYEDTMSEITNMIGDVNSEDGISALVGSDAFETFDVKELLSQAFNGGATINLGFLDEATAEINDKIDGALNGLCKGFKLGGNSCGGLPIPFNQAFLAPGKYHLFGCYNLPLAPLDKGLPLLAFPTNSVIPIWPPSPAGAGGLFPGAPTSQFRLYIAPTLTMQIGVAMCLGPYSLGANLPKPFRDIAGNCIVVALPIPLPCGKKSNSTTSTDQYPQWMNEVASNANSCNSFVGPSSISNGYSPSPFQLVGSSESSPNSTPVIPQNSYAFGFIQIDKDPIGVEEEVKAPEITIGGVKLQGGKDIKNQIKGGLVKGLKKLIIDNRLDRQIKYIMNNLTKMDVTIYLPQLDDLSKGLSFGDLQEKSSEFKQAKVDLKNKNQIAATTKLKKSKLLKGSQLKSVSSNLSNPFDYMAGLFNDTKLIKINQKNINIKVPMIYSEDINAYSSYLKQRKNINLGEKDENGNLIKEGIIHKWKNLLYGVIGMCALDSQKIAEKEGLKRKYTEVKRQLTGEVKMFREELKAKREFKSNTDFGKVNECKSDYKKIDILIKFSKTVFNQSAENFLSLEKESIIDLIKRCSIKFNSNQGNTSTFVPDIQENKLKESLEISSKNIKNTSKEIENYILKNNLQEQGLTGDNLTGSKVEQCLDVFGGVDFDLILDGFLSLDANTAQLETSIRENIKTLELYKKFPLELYEWIHIQDKYLGEISSLLTNFVGKITSRITTNANRYSQYVNSLVTLIGIIKTYQILIDFSVNRSERCGKCTNDTYDSYSCSLSMLCPDIGLPILAIPSFKIPNIIIDLSSVNLGMDILLPKFNFTPTKIALVKIPNLPEPPKFNANISLEDQLKIGLNLIGDITASLSFVKDINIPSIPQLPKPPQLPQPPTLLPTVNLELPVLPPAPKLPEISTSIKGVLKTAEVIGKIICIVKGGIGLVGEKGVKGKIEQLTQRTYDVPFFDFMNLTMKFKDPPLKGFDYEIDSYVNLQFNFDGVYSVFDGLADQINKYSQGFENVTEKTIGQITNELNNGEIPWTDTSVGEVFSEIQGGDNINIDLNSGTILNYSPNSKTKVASLNDKVVINTGGNEIEYNLIDHQTAKKGLVEGLAYFQTISSDQQTSKKINEILQEIQDVKIQGQTDEIINIGQQAQEIIAKQRKENIQLAQNIKTDYDGFIKIIEKNPTKLVSNDEINIELKADLFKIPDQTKKILLAQENPVKTYTDAQSKMVKGYLNALNTNDAKSLNMTQLSYSKSINYLSNLDKKIQLVSNQLNKSQIIKPDYK
ncbi:MAG: VCBS repeat-containing protein, partial [Candidatus Absconditicoccaceae bacterium]